MSILNMTSIDAVLKQHYDRQMVENLVYKNHPLMAILPKYEKMGGRNFPLPMISGNPQNRSATFTNAHNATTSSQLEAFLLTRVKNYSLAFIDGETLKASEGDVNAFITGATLEIDGALNALAQDIAQSLARDGSGSRGQVSAAPSVASTTVITLTSAADVTGFEQGMDIVVYSAASGGSQRIFDTAVYDGLISAVDRSAGTITINTPFTGNGTITTNDYLFVNGDRGLKITGLAGWIPSTAPASNDSFFGVNRSVDASRLAGVRTTGTARPIEEALINSGADIAMNGGIPDYCFMNFLEYRKLVNQMGSKVQYIDLEVNEGRIGFRGVLIHGAEGPIKVVPDRTIPSSVAYLLSMDSWMLGSLGPVCQILDYDNQQMLRQATADAYEVRTGSYAQLGCKAPGWNGVVSLDAP